MMINWVVATNVREFEKEGDFEDCKKYVIESLVDDLDWVNGSFQTKFHTVLSVAAYDEDGELLQEANSDKVQEVENLIVEALENAIIESNGNVRHNEEVSSWLRSIM